MDFVIVEGDFGRFSLNINNGNSFEFVSNGVVVDSCGREFVGISGFKCEVSLFGDCS